MAYELIQNGNTQFAVDWDIVRRLVKSYWLAKLQLSYGRAESVSEKTLNPFTWALPSVWHIEVDWAKVRSRAEECADRDVQTLRNLAKKEASRAAYALEEFVEVAAQNRENFVDWMGKIQTQNMSEVEASVESYESMKSAVKFLRDTSADGIMVCATFLTGGAAVAVLGSTSFAKGYFKFQDDGSVGAAVMEGVGSFAFAYIKLGAGTLSGKQEMVLALVQSSYKAGTELVAGKSVKDAVVSGAIKLTDPVAGKLFKTDAGKAVLNKVAVPIQVLYEKNGQKAVNITADLLAKGLPKVVQNTTKLAVGGSKSSSGGGSSGGSGKASVLDDATTTNKLLLWLGFVNMDKGIGRGW